MTPASPLRDWSVAHFEARCRRARIRRTAAAIITIIVTGAATGCAVALVVHGGL